jgi:excinuclease ABC subunit A
MNAADHLIDIGPGAGEHGGKVVAAGTAAQVMRVKDSLTGQYLSGVREIPYPAKRRKASGHVTVKGAVEHNLRDITVKFPLGVFTCVTGVSGSGKSTLVNDILLRSASAELQRSRQRAGRHKAVVGLDSLDKVIAVDQSPIGRTPRSNPATYIGLFDQVRELYSKTPDAMARGYRPGRFSFNVKGGRCEVCRGDGQLKIEMHFLPDVYVPCEQCGGKRYNRETLEVRYKGRTIADVLAMSCEDALEFFEAIPKIRRRVQALCDVGLEYMRLGQSATTLSGGEAQRVKLAAELSKVATGSTLYVLDEPTTGLHFADIERLLEVLQRLVDSGNSVVVIEHNLDVIRAADWLIDLGPEGGEGGGSLVAAGTPEQVAKVDASYTGQFLKEALAARKSGPAAKAKPTAKPKPKARSKARQVAAPKAKS